MNSKSKKKYEHFESYVQDSEPVISGTGAEGQLVLKGKANKWIKLNRLPKESLQHYRERLDEEKKVLARYKSHLLFAKSHDTSGSRLVAVAVSRKSIGYGWMPVLGLQPVSLDSAKTIAIWLNSTLGRISLRQVTARKLGYPQFNPIAFDGILFPDVDDKEVVAELVSCFDNTKDQTVPRFREGRTEIREYWDDSVASAFGIDRSLIAECAERLSKDPFVSKDRFYDL